MSPARRRRAAFRVLVTWAALLAVLVSVVGAAFVAPSAVAAVPAPSPTTAVVNVNVGGDRLTIGTGVTSVAPLAGVTLGLFTAATGGTQVGASCVSDAQGDCSFIVSAPNLGTRPWVRGISAPTGWALNDPVRIGGSGGAGTTPPYSFQTPTLVAGNTYETGNTYSGGEFMLNRPSTIGGQSSGIWQLRRDNPPLPAKCGLDIALVLDMSGSLDINETFDDMRGAADTILNSLVGTPTRVATFSYSTRSPFDPNGPLAPLPLANFPALTSVQTQAGANTVKAQYAGAFTADGGTNWDEAFWNVAQAGPHYDLVVNLTDGNPTVHSTGVGDDPDNDFTDIEYGVFSANLVKSELSRVISVAVGNTTTGGFVGNPANLIAISGPTAGSDYFHTTDFPAAAAAITAVATAGCPTVRLQKSFPDGRIAASDQVNLRMTTGATQVGTTGLTAGAETGIQNQSPAEIAGPTRAFTGTSYTITETMAAGSTSTLAAYTTTWQCLNGTTVIASGTGATGTFTFPDLVTVQPNAVVCTFSNARPQVSITVTKAWVVDGVAYANGAQPAGLSAQLKLTGPGAAGASNQDWGEPRTGYALGSTATVTETVQLQSPWTNCETTAAVTQVNGTTTNVALTAAGYVATLSQPSTTVQLTNTVTCEQNLTLVKAVAFGDEPTTSWTLNAQAPAGALPGPTGTHSTTTAVTAAVTPAVPYALTESGGPDTYVAVGSWACVLTADGVTPVAVSSGSVTVPRGQDVTCTITNSTASITLLKHVIDPVTGFEADAWNVTATPTALAGGTLPTETRTGAETDVAGASTFEVRPGHDYSLSEAANTATLAYRQVGLERFDGTTWVPVASADIQAPAAGQNAIYRFVNERIPPVMLPLTGGTSADAFLIWGGAVLAMAMAGAIGTVRRRRSMT